MFDSKKKSLFEVKATSGNTKTTSAFVNAALKTGAETLSGNGALKYSTN